MFNGIIYQQGTISKFTKLNTGTKIFIKSKLKLNKKDIGSSIACDGVCLTLISIKSKLIEFYLSNETLKRSKFKSIKIGDHINLELPLKRGQKIILAVKRLAFFMVRARVILRLCVIGFRRL